MFIVSSKYKEVIHSIIFDINDIIAQLGFSLSEWGEFEEDKHFLI